MFILTEPHSVPTVIDTYANYTQEDSGHPWTDHYGDSVDYLRGLNNQTERTPEGTVSTYPVMTYLRGVMVYDGVNYQRCVPNMGRIGECECDDNLAPNQIDGRPVAVSIRQR